MDKQTLINAFYKLERKYRLKRQEIRQFAEAYRRYHMFRATESLEKASIGLYMPSEAKGRLLTSEGRETPRVLNWYCLTPFGVELMKEFISENKWHHTYNQFLFDYTL